MIKFILTENTKNFHIAFGEYNFHMNKEMTKAMIFNNPAYFTPGKYGKDFIKIIDAGECNIKEENNQLTVHFAGKIIKGMHNFQTKNKCFYKISKENKQEKSFSSIQSKFIDFSALASQVKFPYKFKTGAFSEGTWHNTFYSWDVIKNAAPKIMNSSLVTHHIDDTKTILTEVGKVINYEIDEANKRLNIEGELFETTAGKDTAILLANKRIPDVSVRIKEDAENGVCNEIIEWAHVAFVREGEVTDAKIQYN